MEHKKSSIKLTIIPSKVVPAAAVTLSFPAPDLNWHVLQKLKQEKPCGCMSLAAYSEYTAAVYSIYDDICDRLMGTPDAQNKSKVSSIKCGYVNGDFIISFVCQNSFTAIRKSVGMAVSRTNPQKQFPRYSKYIRLLGGKPNRSEFMHCAKRIAKSLNICIFVVAKINITPEKEKNMTEVVFNKMPDIGSIEAGTKPESENTPRGKTEFREIKTTGYDNLFLLDYLDFMNMPALGSGEGLIVYDKKNTPAKIDSINRFVDSKYGKLEDKLTPVLLYSACSRALLNCPTMKSLSSANIKPADIKKIIKSYLG